MYNTAVKPFISSTLEKIKRFRLILDVQTHPSPAPHKDKGVENVLEVLLCH